MNPRALLVTASRHGSAVRETLESLGVEVDRTSTCREARIAIEQRPEYYLIVSDVSLLDGNWWIVFRELARLGRRTELVVRVSPEDWDTQCTRTSVRGLAELLSPPYDRASVERLLEKLGDSGHRAF